MSKAIDNIEILGWEQIASAPASKSMRHALHRCFGHYANTPKDVASITAIEASDMLAIFAKCAERQQNKEHNGE